MRQPFLVTVLVTLQTLCLAANSTPPSPPPGVTTARVEPEELPAVFGGHNVVVFKCWTNKPIAQSFWTFEDKRLSENDPKRHQSITKVNGTTVATLSIIDPTPQDKGHYKCHIRAWDGSNATSNEAVLVNAKGLAENTTITIVRGKTQTISCPSSHDESSRGDFLSQLWIRMDSVTLYNGSKYIITKNKLTIRFVQDTDMGVYECITYTTYGKSSARVTVIVAGLPDPPLFEKAYEGSVAVCTDVPIRWKLRFDGNAQITENAITCIVDDQINNKTEVFQETYPFNATLGTVSKMEPRLSYSCKMTSCNALGCSNASNLVNLQCINKENGISTSRPYSASSASKTTNTPTPAKVSESKNSTNVTATPSSSNKVNQSSLSTSEIIVIVVVVSVVAVAGVCAVFFCVRRSHNIANNCICKFLDCRGCKKKNNLLEPTASTETAGTETAGTETASTETANKQYKLESFEQRIPEAMTIASRLDPESRRKTTRKLKPIFEAAEIGKYDEASFRLKQARQFMHTEVTANPNIPYFKEILDILTELSNLIQNTIV
ncbi:uncharacterized protein LOC134184216 isoform X2 [Corticium candelabrum]|uniref:uncharacterized protein LOC134184216 isoform X2 n=1 Tax=Corticium candelabrum TaxID=121492 RepID=UPI002E3008FF|nr:uncharacterized protein LOC134184216 isoform X2 [Corticium candelabrum]